MKHTFAAALCASLLVLSASSARAASINIHVQINTASLMGNPSGPFALDFQLNGGNPLANSATVTNFTFGTGGATLAPGPTTFGLAAGSLTSSVTLGDNVANTFNEFYQGFTPGSLLNFDVALTSNVNSPTPDVFVVSILQDALSVFPPTIPTAAPIGDALLLVNLSSANLGPASLQTFRGTGAFSGVTVTADIVPEPASLLLLGTGIAGSGVRRWRRRHAQA